MSVEAFRVENFMCFEDSGWIELRPITLFYGRNSAGKSALLRSLLLLRQSVRSQPDESALIFVLEDVLGRAHNLDFGSYYDLVRDHNTEARMSFWFQCNLVEDAKVGLPSDMAAIGGGLGIEPTVKVRLSYGLLPENEHVGLFAIALYDEAEENLIWQAQLEQTSDDQPWHFTLGSKQGANSWPGATLAVEEGFFPKLRLLSEVESTGEVAMTELHHIQQLLPHLERSIYAFLKSLEYLGPLRAQPQRFYYVPAPPQSPPTLGGKGGRMVEQNTGEMVRTLVKADSNGNLGLEHINQWLASSAFEVHLELKPLDENKTLYQLLLYDTLNGRKRPFQSNIRDVSFGISQVLPVVVEALLASEDKTLLLEQPELHLHPGAQLQLGNLFVKMARQGVRFLIETHSEYLFIRLRRWVAETSSGRMRLGNLDEYLEEQELGVYFINRDASRGVSTAARVEIGAYGEYLNTPDGFKGYFADDLRETVELSRARLAARKVFKELYPKSRRAKDDTDRLFEKMAEYVIREHYDCPHCYPHTPAPVDKEAGEVDIYGYESDTAHDVIRIWVGECKLRRLSEEKLITTSEVRQLANKCRSIKAYEERLRGGAVEIHCFMISNAKDMEADAWQEAAKLKNFRFISTRLINNWQNRSDWRIIEVEELEPERVGSSWQAKSLQIFNLEAKS